MQYVRRPRRRYLSKTVFVGNRERELATPIARGFFNLPQDFTNCEPSAVDADSEDDVKASSPAWRSTALRSARPWTGSCDQSSRQPQLRSRGACANPLGRPRRRYCRLLTNGEVKCRRPLSVPREV